MKKFNNEGGYSFGISDSIDSNTRIDFIDTCYTVYDFEKRTIKKRHLTFRLLRVVVLDTECGDNT